MDIKSLMIGDWVSYHGIVNKVAPADFCQKKWIAKIEPIPLTPEILEKNGFEKDSYGVYRNSKSYFIPTYQNGFDIGTWETYIEPTEGIGYFSGDLRYVHQLQHALRLCGIEKQIEL